MTAETSEDTIQARQGDELPPNLEEYLRDQLQVSGEYAVRQFPGGFSNLTYLISFGDKKFVLRRPPRGTKAKTAHDMGREYFVLTHLKDAFPQCPDPVHFCEDESVIGSPFYVMSFLPGLILRRDLPSSLKLTEDQYREQIRQVIALQVKLHKLDYKSLGLGEFGQPEGYVKRQVTGWSKRYRAARTDDAPDFEEVMKWLDEQQPKEQVSRSALIHNDFKLDNIVFDKADPTKIIGVLDWEMATIGDPYMDLGCSLAYWIEAQDPPYLQACRTLPSDQPFYPGRTQQLQWYEEFSGRKLDNWNFYYVFGLFRLAVIAQQIYYRYKNGQTKDERFGQLIYGVQGLDKTCRKLLG
jgi:aminoglycoside phosphotransferase (APT) family kinase protein